MERLARESGREFKDVPREEMETYWEAAKKLEGSHHALDRPVCRHDKHGGGSNFQIGFSPNLSLEINAAMEFIEPFALPNDDP